MRFFFCRLECHGHNSRKSITCGASVNSEVQNKELLRLQSATTSWAVSGKEQKRHATSEIRCQRGLLFSVSCHAEAVAEGDLQGNNHDQFIKMNSAHMGCESRPRF